MLRCSKLVGKKHMKMCSDVQNRVGTPHIKMCSDVHTRVGTPHMKTRVGTPHMKMCSDVDGDTARKNVLRCLYWM